MKIKTVALSVLIVQLVILALICWTWYRTFVSDFGGGEMAGAMGILLIISTIYYFALTVCAYILFKKAEESKNFYFKILLIAC